MKLFFLLFATILTFISVDATPIPTYIYGPCQKRCIAHFGEVKERITNIDTFYRDIDVFNKTDFSLCRLGCSHPEFTTLNLPAFLYGQLAYHDILANKDRNTHRENVIENVDVLCLDRTEQGTSTAINNELTGKVVMVPYEGVDPLKIVHSIEILGSDYEETFLLHQKWCFSSSCAVSFNISSIPKFRLRVSTFDDYGIVGYPIHSRWYEMEYIFSNPENRMTLKSIEWNDDKAAALFELENATTTYIPKCSFQINHKNVLSGEEKSTEFYMDHTRQILVKNLDFNQNYTVNLSVSNYTSETITVNVPSCGEMVQEESMCAPHSISAITWFWNTSSELDSKLFIDWTYHSALDERIDTQKESINISHFHFSLNPLITPGNDKCEKYQSIRKDVSFPQRTFVFNVLDAKCNYEIEGTVVDSKRRKSESKKMKVTRVNQPSFMALLPSSDIQTTIGLIVLLLSLLCSLFLILLVCFLKRRKALKRLKNAKKGTVMYAYVDEETRNIIGVRPSGCQFVPIGNSKRIIEGAFSQRAINCTLPDGSKGGIFHNAFTNQLQYQPHSDSITPRPYGDFDPENPYDYIMESELSDDVFEEEILLRTPSLRQYDSPAYSPMITPSEDFKNLPAYAYRYGKPPVTMNS